MGEKQVALKTRAPCAESGKVVVFRAFLSNNGLAVGRQIRGRQLELPPPLLRTVDMVPYHGVALSGSSNR